MNPHNKNFVRDACRNPSPWWADVLAALAFALAFLWLIAQFMGGL